MGGGVKEPKNIITITPFLIATIIPSNNSSCWNICGLNHQDLFIAGDIVVSCHAEPKSSLPGRPHSTFIASDLFL